jgi:single-strand DNA-binding protein
MNDLNECFMVGRLVRDPDLSYTKQNQALCKFSIANNEKSSDYEYTNFISCKAWHKTAEFVNQHCKKGKRVLVKGKIRQERWEDRGTGQQRSYMILLVSEVVFMDGKNDKDNSEDNPEDYNTGSFDA